MIDSCPTCGSKEDFHPPEFVDNGVGLEKHQPAHCENCGYDENKLLEDFIDFMQQKRDQTEKPPEKYRRPSWRTGTEKNDWSEDFSLKDENYFLTCEQCGLHFAGHKTRKICKVCDQTQLVTKG